MIREQIERLLPFFALREVPERAATPEEAVSVHAAAQRVDTAYERFRNLLDQGDEDILRRKAILRFLSRRWSLASQADTFAVSLLKSLAYGRYIPDNTHAKHAVGIARVVRKAFTVWQLSDRRMPEWFLPVIAVEVDRVVYPREADDALVHLFFSDVRARAVWEDDLVAPDDQDTQLFLACHRALSKTEDAELFWHLFRAAEPAWSFDATPDDLAHIVEHFPGLQTEITAALRHPAAPRLLARMQPLSVPYRILRDILRREDAADILGQAERLGAAVSAVVTDRVQKLERQMLRRVWHAVLFLFLSKGILAFAIEIPYELVLSEVRAIPLLINLFFPPVLLLLMTGTVPRPGRANTDALMGIVQAIVSGSAALPEVVIRAPQRNTFRKSVFTLVYGIVTLALLGVIVWFLRALNYSLAGGFFFVVFLGLVSFLGIRLRSAIRELRVIVPREGFLSAMGSFFSLPIIDFGRQISIRAQQVNVFLFLLDAIIEAPFKVLIGLVEEWFTYLRERREEIT